MMTMGRSRQLRDPPRQIRGDMRVLIFALDGVGRDALYGSLRSGRMPILASVLGEEVGGGRFAHAYAESEMLSIIPSTTIPAWAALFSAEPPAVNGVPGNEWFDRQEGKFHAPVPVTVSSRSHATRIFTDEYLSGVLRSSTIYERLPPVRMHVSMNPVYRGADLVTFPDAADFGDLVGAIVGETLAGSLRESARVAREMDQTSVGSLIDVIEDVGLPDLQTVYFNGIDLMTHYAADPEEDQRRYLEAVTDSLIGEVLDVYRAAGALQRTYVIVVADHGHTPVMGDDRHALGTEGDDEPGAVLERAGFRLRPWDISAGEGDFQAAFAYQGFSAFVYLADRSSCPQPGHTCDWTRPPRMEEDVLPAAAAFHAASRDGAGVSAMEGALDLVLARDPERPGRYLVYDGAALVPLGEYLRQNPRPDLPRLEERLSGLAAGPHAHLTGDLLLLANASTDRPIEERFYFGLPQASEHGGAGSEGRIPLIVAHPRHSGEELGRMVTAAIGSEPSQLDFGALVRALLESR